jgi:glucoamylase
VIESLDAWLARQHAHACKQMLRSISRTDLVKQRPGFGQAVRAAAGSVIASPVLADWNPEPDYFFHWFRDSALVIDALRLLHAEGQVGDEALRMLEDFVQFSLALRQVDGGALVRASGWRERAREGFRQYLRDDDELAVVHGQGVIAETRVNADGTLDISKWTRPQHDGAALRALSLLRWLPQLEGGSRLADSLAALVREDLAFILENWELPAYDMWEEERGSHYHTLCVSAAALDAGADLLRDEAAGRGAQACRAAPRRIRARLDEFWLPAAGHYAAHRATSGEESTKALDISVVFAAIHAWNGSAGAHTAGDPRLQATFERLVDLFAAEYPINQSGRAGPAMGRYRGDRYFSGGAYYFSTLGAAELCFRAATLSHGATAAGWSARGDAFLATVQAFTPANGDLSEQFDQRSGEQTSARHLAWSYAGFISCIAARRAAQAARASG